MGEQMTFQRYETKYLITRKQAAAIQKAMAEYMAADPHGKSTLCSLYFDTPDYLLARRSLERPVYKEKLRLRSYGTVCQNRPVFVELKKKCASVVYKRRICMSAPQAYDYLLRGKPAQDSQIAREIDYFLRMHEGIRPAALISVQREAYYAKDDCAGNPYAENRDGGHWNDFRLTFDEGLLWRGYDLGLDFGAYGEPLLDRNYVLMEAKTSHALPLWLVKLLSAHHIYQAHFSKYGAAYAAICQNNGKGGMRRYA